MARWEKFFTFTFDEVTTRDNDYTSFEVDVKVVMEADPSYGADADGRRGVYTEFIDEVIIVATRGEGGLPLAWYDEDKILEKVDKELEKVDLSRDED